MGYKEFDLKAFMEAIVTIEKECDVNAFRYGEIEIWPLIRLSLFMGIMMDADQKSPNGPYGSSTGSFLHESFKAIKHTLKNNAAMLVNHFTYQKYLRDLQRIGPVDFLFFSRVEDHTDKLNGKYFDRYIDPIIDFVRGRYSYCKLELTADRGRASLPRYESTHFINPRYFLSRRTIKARASKKMPRILGFDGVKKKIDGFRLNMYFDEEGLISLAHGLTWWSIFFDEVLRVIRPKAVFLVFSPGQQALIRACKKNRIITIDIQHGFLDGYHPMYTHWTNIPDKGYKQLPDFYWLWEQQSKHYIAASCPNGNRHHKPIVGGNSWLAYWKKNRRLFSLSEQIEDFIKYLRVFNKIIIVACGSVRLIHDFIPEHVSAAMRCSPDDWIWLIRLHPRQTQGMDEITSYLNKCGVKKNYEMELSSSIPLYKLLENATTVVTAFSSVCYEALAFDVPSIIVHPAGLQIYRDCINRGTFYYASDETILIKYIKNGNALKAQTEDDVYIETSDKAADMALKSIIDSIFFTIEK